jgi:hypothetical protein
MRTFILSLLAALLCSTALTAQAEGNGLRLKEYSEGITLHSVENGLRLQFVPSPWGTNAPAAEQSTPAFEAGTSKARSMLRADWPVFGFGLHTSLGLDWSNPTKPSSAIDVKALGAMPFLGLGWESGADASRWKLSAEIGTAFASGQPCNALVGCPRSRLTGLNPYGYGSGLRLNPYVNFGATFTFGQ